MSDYGTELLRRQLNGTFLLLRRFSVHVQT
jgi:hypothetical protein